MKRQTKFTAQEQAQHAEEKSHQTSVREFAAVEDLLRHDAGQTVVPPGIAERLARSVQNVPAPERSWWHRWLKRG